MRRGALLRALFIAALGWLSAGTLWVMVSPLLPEALRGFPFGVLGLFFPLGVAVFLFRRVRRAADLEAAWLEKSVVTPSGFRLIPGAGDSAQNAIVVLERNPENIPKAELEYAMTRVLNAPGATWQLAGQRLQPHGRAMQDVLTFKNDSGETRQLYFELTRSPLF